MESKEVVETAREAVDPRVRRTRQLLRQALQKLLETNDFDKITVQDIAEAATVNRVTFYDHYPDKFALLQCLVAGRFQEVISDRGIKFDCSSALESIILAVCDYLGGIARMDSERQRHMEPHLESAVIAVVRRMILEGLQQHPVQTAAPLEMIATTVSWAIYGAAQEWVRQRSRCSSEEIVGAILMLVSPILDRMHATEPAH